MKTNNSRVIVVERKLLGRGQHSIGDVAVGAARSNSKITWQHGTRQANNHLVANLEV